MKRLTCSLLFASVLWPASAADAQTITPPSHRRSLFSNAASIFTVAESGRDPLIANDEIYLKTPGDQSLAPQPWGVVPASPSGQYSLTEMFSNGTIRGMIEIDAMCSGNAFIPTTGGEPQFDGTWAGVLISISNEGNTGLPNQGWVSERTVGNFGSRTTPGADLVTYILEGSTGIHHSAVGQAMFTQLAEHIGLNENQDIDSFDLGAGILRESSGLAQRLLFYKDTEFYFSISMDSATAFHNHEGPNPATFYTFDSMGDQVFLDADAAAVYSMEWEQDGNGGYHWVGPKLFLSRSDLGLSSAADEDIDALSVARGELGSAEDDRIAYSTQPVLGRSQLRVYEGVLGESYDLMAAQGSQTRATQPMGIKEFDTPQDEGDDIDAICIFDPESGDYEGLVGYSIDNPVSEPLGLSVLRLANEKTLFQVTGTPNAPGTLPVSPGFQTPAVMIYYYVAKTPTDVPPAPGNKLWKPLAAAPYPGSSAWIIRDVQPLFGDTPGSGDALVFFHARISDLDGGWKDVLRESWTTGLSD